MTDLKSLAGKVISDIKKGTDNKSSYIIIKFNDGSKINISGFSNDGKGVGQLDLNIEEMKSSKIIGSQIDTIIEEFDGDADNIIIKFRNGGKIIITPFNSSESSTAGIKTTIYSSEKIQESKIKNNKMKKQIKLVAETLQESLTFNQLNEGRPYINYAAKNAAASDMEDIASRKGKMAFDTDDEGPYYDPTEYGGDKSVIGDRDEFGRARYRPDLEDDVEDYEPSEEEQDEMDRLEAKRQMWAQRRAEKGDLRTPEEILRDKHAAKDAKCAAGLGRTNKCGADTLAAKRAKYAARFQK